MDRLSRYLRTEITEEERRQEQFRRQVQLDKQQNLGRKIVTPDPTGEGYLLYGNLFDPFASCDFNTAFIGQTGSGKNNGGFDRLLLSYYEAVKTSKPKYFLHLLSKENSTERLALKALARRSGLQYGIYRIDKLNRDSIAIDIGGTIAESRSPRLTINELADSIFPQHDNSNPFFPTSASQVTSLVTLALRMKLGANFGLPELVDICLADIDTIIKYMKTTERGRNLAETFFAKDRGKDTSASIDATIKAQIARLEIAANIEYFIRKHAPQRLLTVRDIISGQPRTTAFYAPTEFMATFQPILNFVTGLIGSTVTSLSNNNSRVIVMFVDELPVFGLLKLVPQLVTLARSSGFRLVCVFQDMVNLDQHYQKVTDSIVANCGVLGIFKGTSPRTTKFISDLLGARYVHTATPSFGERISYNFNRQLKPYLEAASIQQLKTASRATGIEAYIALPNRKVELIRIQPAEIDQQIALFQALADEQQALDSMPVAQIKRPPLFSDPERMRILKTAFTSNQIYQAYMSGYKEGSPRAKIRQETYRIMEAIFVNDAEDLRQFMHNYADEP